jgi:pimeloyl-ACP methyl ester carboxylesterase
MNVQSHVAISADGVPIHYDVQGNGVTALVFVHGWCCNRHFWDRQVDYFAPHYTVVSLDLAGHGASGRDRTQWTVPAFGQDIIAVVEQLGLEQVVLIGHSLGGPVIVEAARHLPTSLRGLIGVDTLWNVEQSRTPAQVAEFMAPFRANFVEAARTFVRTMFLPTSEASLAADIVTAMAAAPPQIGINALAESMGNDRNVRGGLQEITAPKMLINSAHWRVTNREAAQRYGIDVVLMSGVGHFVMIEDPQTFNRLLDEAVQNCLHARARQ